MSLRNPIACTVLLVVGLSIASPSAHALPERGTPGLNAAEVLGFGDVTSSLTDGGDCDTTQIILFGGPGPAYGTKSKMRFFERAVTNCPSDVQTGSAVVIHDDETHWIWFGWGIPPRRRRM